MAAHYDLDLRLINPRQPSSRSPYGDTGPTRTTPPPTSPLFFASGIACLLTGRSTICRRRRSGRWASSRRSSPGWPLPRRMHAVLGNQQGATTTCRSGRRWRPGDDRADACRAGAQELGAQRTGDGNGATVTILPARDGHVAISPREEKQWAAWLEAMGRRPGADPRFARKPDW